VPAVPPPKTTNFLLMVYSYEKEATPQAPRRYQITSV